MKFTPPMTVGCRVPLNLPEVGANRGEIPQPTFPHKRHSIILVERAWNRCTHLVGNYGAPGHLALVPQVLKECDRNLDATSRMEGRAIDKQPHWGSTSRSVGGAALCRSVDILVGGPNVWSQTVVDGSRAPADGSFVRK